MAKVGYKKDAPATQMASHPDATTNLAGGLAFNINDPSVKLLTMIGASFFEEPTYYEPSDEDKKLDRQPVLAQLGKDGKASAEALSKLTDRSREVIETAIKVAQSENPRDLLALAHWCRTEMNIRTTPQVLLAVAAACPATRGMVRDYAVKVVRRADEIRDVFAIFTHFFGRKMPHSLNDGLCQAFAKFRESDFLKYDGTDHPTFKDVLLMLHGGSALRRIKKLPDTSKVKDYPVSKGVFDFLVNGKVSDAEATPVIAARKAMHEQKTWGDDAKKHAKASFANWEVILTQFGQDKESKAALWSFLVEEKLLGYMAMLRNLRNVLEAKVSKDVVKKVAQRLSDPEEVKNSKQLPFRFFSAYRILDKGAESRYEVGRGKGRMREMGEVDEASVGLLLEAIDKALKISAEALPKFPGVTAVFADNSGSMSSPLSEKSTLSVADAANILCSLSLFTCEEAIVGAFGDDVAICRLSKEDKILRNMEKIAKADTKGCSTNAYRIFQHLKAKKIHVDRVIILSDMQCWNSGGSGGIYGGCDAQLAPCFLEYKRQVNPKVILHTVDLQGHGQAVVPADEPGVNVVSGFSEKILKRLAEFEGVATPDGKPIPTIEYVRGNF